MIARNVAAVFGLCALLSGCPESVHPVSDPSGATHDEALFGTWQGTIEGDELYLHVGPGPRGMTSAATVAHKKKDGSIKVERYLAFPSRLKGLTMLNARPLDDASYYLLFRYEAGPKELTLWLTSYAAVRADIRAGKLKGIAEPGEFGETRITASSAEIAAYLLAADRKRLFDKPLVFRKV